MKEKSEPSFLPGRFQIRFLQILRNETSQIPWQRYALEL